MNIITTSDMRRLDNITIEEYSISSLQLMRNAAGALKNYIDITYDKEDHIMIEIGRAHV